MKQKRSIINRTDKRQQNTKDPVKKTGTDVDNKSTTPDCTSSVCMNSWKPNIGTR